MSLRVPWNITHTAILAFQKRVAPGIPYDEIRQWLIKNAHKGRLLKARAPLGQLQYRLEHPWGSPDAVLVVRKANESDHGVVLTCAWWDDSVTIEQDEMQLALSLAADRAATPPQEPKKPAPPPPPPKPRIELPMPPEDLPVPEGTRMSLSFLREGWTMDHTQLQTSAAARWRAYLLDLEAFLLPQPRGPQLRAVYVALKQIKTHLRALANKASGTPRPRGFGSAQMLEAMRQVLEELYGREHTDLLFKLATDRKEANIAALLAADQSEEEGEASWQDTSSL